MLVRMPVPLGSHEKTTYEIRVPGEVAPEFVGEIGARSCRLSEGTTVIVIDVLDQSHLQGIFDRLGDLNIDIESVNPA